MGWLGEGKTVGAWIAWVREPGRRAWVVGALHVAVWSVSLLGALAWAAGGVPGPRALVAAGVVAMGVKGLVARLSGSFHELWRHACIEDLATLLGTAAGAATVMATALALLGTPGAPPSVAALDAAISVALLGGLRMTPRLWHEVVEPALWRRGSPVILVGRADSLDLELRRLRAQARAELRPVGLLVEGPPLAGSRLRRVPVLDRARFEAALRDKRVAEVVLVPPLGALGPAVEDLASRAGVRCRPAPSPHALTELMDHAAESLLGRPPVELDGGSIARVASGRRVLVTGAGGSIGSELARQVARWAPETLILVERSENALFHIERSLAGAACHVEARVLDVRDEAGLDRLFAALRPDVVFHAAAHKHVPMMERHPSEAVLNNVIGTRLVADAAHRHGASAFVFISTDKAVNPTSVMGATKRLGELYIQGLARRSETRFVAVRFGNVLGSNGSVVPIFIEQIRRGGPVTITHPEMSRYFMSIPEACQLVLQAAALGAGGEVFVLDMGAAVKIMDLARRLIEGAGLRPDDDVPVVISGARPGEKLHEQLTRREEGAQRTRHPRIFVGTIDEVDFPSLVRGLAEIEAMARAGHDAAVLRALRQLVPEYAPEAQVSEVRAAAARAASEGGEVREALPAMRSLPGRQVTAAG